MRELGRRGVEGREGGLLREAEVERLESEGSIYSSKATGSNLARMYVEHLNCAWY